MNTETLPLKRLFNWQQYKRRKEAGTNTGIPFCPHAPTARQAEFLALSDCREALFGGSAGGGKSDALLMGALQYVDRPGYAAIIFRRSYADLALPNAIMDRAKQWLQGTEAHWSGDTKTWTFPSGSTLTFSYLASDDDRFRYQSAEFQFIAFDELTQFSERQYTYLFSRLRKHTDSPVPLRMRGASNPGGFGHTWVKEHWGISNEGTVPHPNPDRKFVPSRLADNPYVDRASYEENLAKLDPTTQKQLRDGLWVQDSSGLVYSSFRPSLVVPRPEIDNQWRFILAFDFGVVDATAWVVLAWRRHSHVVHVLEAQQQPGMSPSEVGELAVNLQRRYKFDRIVGDVGGLGKGYAEEMRRRFRIPIEPAEKQNKLGFIKLLNGAFSNREILVVEGCSDLVEQLSELPWKDEDHTREAEGCPNHLSDSLLYGWRAATAWAEPEEAPPPLPPGSPEAIQLQQRLDKEAAIRASNERARKQSRQLVRMYSR